MDNFFNHYYRVPSARHPHWDYSWSGWYFVTINTSRRERFFGTIMDGRMVLSNMGEIAQLIWHLIPGQFGHAIVDEFVVMPDHIHGIVIITHSPGSRVFLPWIPLIPVVLPVCPIPCWPVVQYRKSSAGTKAGAPMISAPPIPDSRGNPVSTTTSSATMPNWNGSGAISG